MFRLRDHVISLVAVFLALGLGIIIGTSISENMLVTQQRLLIEQMTNDYRSLREERMQLEASLQSLTRDLYLWEKFQEALYPNLVKDALKEKKIAIIYHATSIPQGVLSMLQDAGTVICSVIQIEDVATLSGKTAGLGKILSTMLIKESLSEEMNAQLMPFLERQEVKIEIEPLERADAVLLLCGEQGQIDKKLLQEIVQLLRDEAITVVGLERSDVKKSCLGELKSWGISTIDNVETIFGQYSLLSVLRGCAGNFGIKEAADELIATF
ncbi:MAG: copper transporter [Firmicutes bacterium]|nr:copper transporter [Bacillota bacterium]